MCIAVAMTILATSCNKEEQPSGANWGTTEWYEGAWYYDYEPNIMTKTIELEFNSDAWGYINADNGYIELSISTSADEITTPEDINVYFNGELTEGGVFKIIPSEMTQETFNGNVVLSGELGIEFLDSATEGTHQYYIHYTGKCDGNKKITVDDMPIATDPNSVYVTVEGTLGDGLRVTKVDKINPGSQIIIWVIIIIVSALLLWLIIGRRIVYTRMDAMTLQFIGPGYFSRSIRLGGKYRVVLTSDETKKQSWFSALFTGKIEYIYDENWTSDITFKYRGRRKATIECGDGWVCSNFAIDKNQRYTLENRSKKLKAEIIAS